MSTCSRAVRRAVAALLALAACLVVVPAVADEPAGQVVTGRLVDDAGEPVRPATLWAVGGTTSAVDPFGSFEVVVPEGSTLALTVALPIRLQFDLAVRAAGPRVELGDLVVPTGIALADLGIRVLAPDGTPVAAAEIRGRSDLVETASPPHLADGVDVQSATYESSTRTGSDGAAGLRIPAGARAPEMTVAATLSNGHGWNHTFAAGSPVVNGSAELRLPASPSFDGRIVDAAGTPVAGVTVSVQGGGRSSSDVTGASGTFAFPVPPRTSSLSVVLPRQNPWGRTYLRYEVRVTAPADAHDLGDLVLPDLPLTRIRVVDSEGKPVAGAYVGSYFDLDLLDPELGWDGADDQLAEGLSLVDGVLQFRRPTGSDGELTVPLPRRTVGGLADLPVEYWHDDLDRPDVATGSTADAVEQPDGTFLLRLDDLDRPVPNAPRNVRAAAADGVVVLSWSPPLETVPGTWIDHYLVTDLVTGVTTVQRGSPQATFKAPPAVARSYAVEAVSAFGVGPRATSAAVTPTPTTATVVSGPADGELVLGRAEWRVATSHRVRWLSCSPPRSTASVSCPSFERIVARGLVPGVNRVHVEGSTDVGTRFSWTRSLVAPTQVSQVRHSRAWWSHGRSLVTRKQGARLDLSGAHGRRLHLFADTGRGQGVIEVISRGRVVRRIDLAKRPARDGTHLAVDLPARADGRARVRVVSHDRRVSLRTFAFAR